MPKRISWRGVGSKTGAALLIVSLFAVFALHDPQDASAAANNGITVTPARLNFSLSKDAPNQRITVTLTNNYTSPLTLGAEFKGIDEDAGILVPRDDAEAPLAAALKLSETNIRLLPQQPHQLTVQLDNSSALSPGGHYATLVLTQQDGSSSGLALRAAVSLAIFAVKNEGLQQSLSVDSFTTNGWLFRMPSKASLDYRNDGNVHVVPRAEVVVAKEHSLDRLSHGISNQNSVLLLPGKTWQDTVSLDAVRSVWVPTKLQLVAAYRADGAAEPQRIVRTVWYVPPVYPTILLLLAAGFMWRRQQLRTAQPKVAAGSKPAAGHDEPASTARTATKTIVVKEKEPFITLASLEQRTTRITPKQAKTPVKTRTKQPAKNRKKTASKPKSTSRPAKKATASRKKA
jgi:hypothetical protein